MPPTTAKATPCRSDTTARYDAEGAIARRSAFTCDRAEHPSAACEVWAGDDHRAGRSTPTIGPLSLPVAPLRLSHA
jgi:hypothetical protein